MKRYELDTYLTKPQPKGALQYGESSFLIELYSKKIARAISDDTSNHHTFYYSEYALPAVLEILSQNSLFGDSSVVILKLGKKLGKKDITAISQILAQNPTNGIIIEFYQAENKSPIEYSRDFKDFATNFKAAGSADFVEVRFFEPNTNEALDFMRQTAQKLQIKISNQNLLLLLSMQNNDIALAQSELQKFAILDSEVQLTDIERLCYGLCSVDVDELLDCLFAKKEVFLVFEKMLEEGVQDLDIVKEMEEYFYRLFLFFAHARFEGKIEAPKILGFAPPTHIVNAYTTRAQSIKNQNVFLHIFKIFGEWRNKIKYDKTISLQSLIKIQALIR